MKLTRRKLFGMLAGLPVVGRLVAKPETPRFYWRRGSFAERYHARIYQGPVTHYVGFTADAISSEIADKPVNSYSSHATIASALGWVVPGRGDVIYVAAGHVEMPLTAGLDYPFGISGDQLLQALRPQDLYRS